MTTQTLRRDKAMNLEELAALVAELQAVHSDHHPSTIYLETSQGDGVAFTLKEETLTDGSTVLNIVAHAAA